MEWGVGYRSLIGQYTRSSFVREAGDADQLLGVVGDLRVLVFVR